MFTVLSNTRNSSLFLLAALALVIAVLLTFAAAPAISAPQPVRVLVTGISEAGSDYYQRHPELRMAATLVIDTTTDFYLRHPEWVIAPVTNAGDMIGDFYLRHPRWSIDIQSVAIPVSGSSEASDYFTRHPGLIAPAKASVDMTDYYIRQQVLLTAGKPDLTDYFFRHPELGSK